MSLDEFEETGPVDFAILEWPDGRPTADVAPLIVDLVDRGLIRLLDVAFIEKDADGTVSALDLEHHEGAAGALAEFDGASSGLLDFDDLRDAGAALAPGSAAAVIVYENAWLAPLAVALRRSGAQLAANGRIPIQAIIASLDALEATA